MSQEQFAKFTEAIAPFRPLWKSVEVSVLAARVQERWIALATRLRTSELSPDPKHTVFEPIPEMLLFNGLLPIDELGQLAFSMMIDGRLQLRGQGVSESLYLSTQYAGLKRPLDAQVTWSDPWLREDLTANFEHVGLRRPIIQLQGNNARDRFQDFIDSRKRKKLESELLLGEPAFDGLADLRRCYFQGLELEDHSNCNVLILCQIPVELGSANGGLEVSIPPHVENSSVQLQAFFEPRRASARVELNDVSQHGSATKVLRGDVLWPEGSERLKAVVLYDRNRVSHLDVVRWHAAGNLRVLADTFFDTDHRSLKSALFNLSGKRGNEDFEKAVARLMTLLGCPAVVYSSGDDRKPDLAATVLLPNSSPLVLLAECTRERPTARFSPLKERTRELDAVLQGEAKILPIVFTQCEPVEGDYESAADHSIALIGRLELRQMSTWLESPIETAQVIKFLSPSAHLTDVGLIARSVRNLPY